jgi:hypothetical protein
MRGLGYLIDRDGKVSGKADAAKPDGKSGPADPASKAGP